MRHVSTMSMVSVAALGALAGLANGQTTWPDITLSDIQSIASYTAVSGTGAYSIGSHTCNIGNRNSLWTNNGTPGLAMNMYRLTNGRLTQIGMSWVKTACCAAAGTSTICGGSCNGVGGQNFGFSCLDVYSAGWNAGQSRLGPRSGINAYSGAFSPLVPGTFNSIDRRLQVRVNDMTPSNFPGSIWFVEGVYVATDENRITGPMNNATYERINVSSPTSVSMSVGVGGNVVGVPAIQAWRDHGGGVNTIDPNVLIDRIDVPSEGRFFFGHKVTQTGPTTWRYEYAVFNLNSDRAGGSFSIPVDAGVTVSNIGFSMPFYHSGEPASFNDAWTTQRTSNAVVWSTPQTFAQNANSSALRWGTMYNFWFDANIAPTSGNATLGLFKTHSPQSVPMALRVPSIPAPTCDAVDFNNDGVFPDDQDLTDFIFVLGGGACATCNDVDFNNDGVFPDDQDLTTFLFVLGGGSC